jgi:hypothetical protein
MFLRNNQLDDEAVQLISYGIGDLKRQNTKLLHLNLSGNRISDKGASHLARVIIMFCCEINIFTDFFRLFVLIEPY